MADFNSLKIECVQQDCRFVIAIDTCGNDGKLLLRRGLHHLWGRRYLVKGVSRVTIKLTESQRDSLIDFIECNFYPNIQNDDSIDSIDYAIDLLNVYTRLRSAAKHRRSTEAQGRNEAFLPLHSKNEI